MERTFALPQFQQSALLEQALTHRSYTNEYPSAPHNERLEFLGDAILTFLSGEYLYKRFLDSPEGQLTTLRSALVDAPQFAEFARWLELGRLLRLGKGAELQRGRENENLLSSAFEALIGAYFLDQGSCIETVRAYVWPFFEAVESPIPSAAPMLNPKGRLQEVVLAQGQPLPKYLLLQSYGPDHEKIFVVQVSVGGNPLGQGQGHSRQSAEKNAARHALEKMGLG